MVSFPVYLKALGNVLRHRDVAWNATGNRTAVQSPFNFIVPQMLIFGFLTIISVRGIWKTIYTGTLALSLIWNLINTGIFGAFMVAALRESRRIRRAPAPTVEPAAASILYSRTKVRV
jgi:cellulose synthase (UDP-forming)